MSTSQYVCARCGLGAISWRTGRWKHAAGGRSAPSCGQPPDVMPRAEYERQNRLQAKVDAVMSSIYRQL